MKNLIQIYPWRYIYFFHLHYFQTYIYFIIIWFEVIEKLSLEYCQNYSTCNNLGLIEFEGLVATAFLEVGNPTKVVVVVSEAVDSLLW